MNLSSFTESIKPQLQDWRRYFHQHPELGFMEYNTTYNIGKELEKFGFQLYVGKDALRSESRYGVPDEHLLQERESEAYFQGVEGDWLSHLHGGNTGLVATWDTGSPGKHLAFRFDIDALPIQETQEDSHLPYAQGFSSSKKDVMHACGHDGHMTIGLGVAKFIAEHSQELNGRFTLLFQPAEEGGRGAKAMTEKGWLQDVDHFYTGHLGIRDLQVGTVAATTKGFLASSKLNVLFEGESSHAGMKPEDGRNALLAAATATTQIYSIPRHSDGVTRLNVGKLEAGQGRNIIANKGYLELETRGETGEINRFMLDEAKRMIQASADMHNVEAHIDFVGETEGMHCDDELIESITSHCQPSSFIKEVLPSADISGSEDASFMMNEVQAHGGKATYMLFGTSLPFNHHHPSFDFEEDALAVAVDTYIHLVKGENTR